MLETITASDGRSFYPTDELAETTKFKVGTVQDDHGKLYFLKAAIDPTDGSVRDDLANETQWNVTVGTQIDGEIWTVPKVEAHAPDYVWTLFEFVDGHKPKEEQLDLWTLQIAGIADELFRLPLGRDDAAFAQWYRSRIESRADVMNTRYFDNTDRQTLEKIVASDDRTELITPGVVHGDLKPENLLHTLPRAGRIWVLDAEFGTLPGKPDWNWPRFHDMANFYQLLRCQYHSPELAEDFLALCRLNMSESSDMSQEDFTTEFYLSVLERSISMMGHFVVNLPPDKKVDDRRCLEPEPYVGTIRTALEVLS